MTLLFFDGFQDDATNRKPEWSGTASITATGRDGSTNGARAGGNASSMTLTLPSAAATVVMGMAVNVQVLASSTNGIVLGTGSTDDIWLWFNASGYLEARRTSAGGGLIATATILPVPTPRWCYLQVKAVLHLTAGSLICQIDGTEVINVSGVSTGTVTGSCTYIKTNTSLNGTQFDDMYVCDAVDATATQGRANNNFLGDMKVTSLIPSADGDLSQWTPSTGTAHAALVDEVPPNTTDYNFTSVVGNRDLYQLPDLPSTAGAVYGVRLSLYGLKSDAGASSVKPLVKESVGTITAQTAQPLSTTAGAVCGPFLFTKPSASTTPWTSTDINGLQAGAESA